MCIVQVKDALQNFNCSLIISKHLAKVEALRTQTSRCFAECITIIRVILRFKDKLLQSSETYLAKGRPGWPDLLGFGESSPIARKQEERSK